MKTLKTILELLYLIFKPALVPGLAILCILQSCRVSQLRNDGIMLQKGLDTALDLNEEKRTKLEQCEDANYTLTLQEQYSHGLAVEAIDAAQMLSKRLKLTTDIAEVEIECNDKKEIKCLTEPKVRTYLQENRKAKF